MTCGPTGIKLELEIGDDAEVPAAAPHAPEKVGVMFLARLDELAVGGDQVYGQQLIDGEAVLAHDPADAAAQGKARHPVWVTIPEGTASPNCLRLAVKLTKQYARLDTYRPGPRDPLEYPSSGRGR